MRVKILCLILALCFCFLTGCQSGLITPTDTAEETKTEEKKPEKVYPNVGNPLSWEKIREIPIANDSMTGEELRKICVDYMRLQLTFEWTPAKTLSYYFETRGYSMDFPEGRVYGGLPYKTFDGNGNLYIFMDYYNPETGVLDPGKIAGKNFFSIIGNDCASGPFWAWSRAINSITNFEDFENQNGFTNIGLTPQNNLIPVGGYKSISEGTWDDGNGTKAVLQQNGTKKMYECYAQMLEADGLIRLHPKSEGSTSSANHLMMVSGKPKVVRNDDGTINGDRSFVTIMDQESHMTEQLTENGIVHYEGGIDLVYTFSQLYEDCFAPFTFKEFLKTDPVEKAEASIKVDGDMYDYETLKTGTLSANYGISHVRITFFDKDGNKEYSYRPIPKDCDTRNFKLKNLLLPASKWHATEENTCVITAFLGTGEEIEVLRGTVYQKNS